MVPCSLDPDVWLDTFREGGFFEVVEDDDEEEKEEAAAVSEIEGEDALIADLQRHSTAHGTADREGTIRDSSLQAEDVVEGVPMASTYNVHPAQVASVLTQARSMGLHARVVPRNYNVSFEDTDAGVGEKGGKHWQLVVGTDAEAVERLVELQRSKGNDGHLDRQERVHEGAGWFSIFAAGVTGGLTMYFALMKT